MDIESGGFIPVCCGGEMTMIRWGRIIGFAIWIWRCPVCEEFTSTNRRYNGANYWVGKMGRDLKAQREALIADAYTIDDDTSTPRQLQDAPSE